MCVQLHVRISPFCVKRIASGPLITHQVSVQSVPPFPRYGKGGTSARAHMRTCRCTRSMTSIKGIATWSLTTYRISAQPVQPFPRHGKGAHLHVRTCARANYSTHDLCYMHRYLVTHAHQFCTHTINAHQFCHYRPVHS